MKDSVTETNQSKYAPHVALIFVQIFFGCSAVIGKIALAEIPALAIVGFRVGGGALAFCGLLALKRDFWLDKRADYWRFAAFSLFGVVFNHLLFFSGLARTTAVNASLLAVTIPVFALLVGAALRADRLTRRKVTGVILASAGVIYLIDPARASFGSETTQGNVFIMLNCLSYAIYIVISKKMIGHYGALKSIAWIFLMATVVNVPVGLISLSTIELSQVSWGGWLALAGVVIFPTILAYYLNAWALALVEPSIVAVYTYLQPLVGFVFAAAFLGEQWNSRLLAAVALIFAGVYLVNYRRTVKKPDHN